MAEHNDLGMIGEKKAQEYLVEKGYRILATNWRMGSIEADIIAENDKEIVFVEVKTRSTGIFGAPELFVTKTKQRSYVKLADAFVRKVHSQKEVRFDVIAIVMSRSQFTLNHIPRAFSPLELM